MLEEFKQNMAELKTFLITIEYQSGHTGAIPDFVTVTGTVKVISLDMLLMRLCESGFPIPLDLTPGDFSATMYGYTEGIYVPPGRIMKIDWEVVP